MEPVRFGSRPMSPSNSSIASKSSFTSRARSPLSISSSIDQDTDSLDSEPSSSASLSSYNGKPDLAPTRMPPKTHWQQKAPEAIAPLRYGAGGTGRQQARPPQRPGMGFPMGSSQQIRSIPKLSQAAGEGFRKLPQEVLLVILSELKKLHLGRGCLSCSTCWMREVVNLGLSSKKWWSAARVALYQDIQLIGTDSLLHTKKKYKIKHGTRLKLLRRTLRGQGEYGRLVKSLKVPSMPETAKTKQEREEYMDLVASVIMACPNLERLPGFYPKYSHEFSRLIHALTTRTKLQEMVWLINPSPFQRQHRYEISDDAQKPVLLVPVVSGPLLPQQSVDFLFNHSNWTNLKTMILHCNPGGMVDSPLFQDVFESLPQLEHLHVSHFPASAFNDYNLLTLPPLKSLRLDRLPGITDDGLSAFAPTQRGSLKSLSLIQIHLQSLPAIARMLSSFRVLTRLVISQGPAPSLPPGEVIFLHPYLASHSLEYLHWEFTNPDHDTATSILSKAITFDGFPSLRTIRAPTDFDGLLQMHCKPREKIELASDRYRNMGIGNSSTRPGVPHSQSTVSLPEPTKSTFGGFNPPSPTQSTFSLGHSARNSVSSTLLKSPTRSTFSASDYFQPHTDHDNKGISLATARRMAQQRIEAATTSPQFHIIVWDEDGHFQDRFEVGGFLGNVGSKIFYSLKPDVEGMDEAVVRFDSLLDGGDETNGKKGCTGAWCLDVDLRRKGKIVQRKKDEWWHTERGRWKDLELGRFF